MKTITYTSYEVGGKNQSSYFSHSGYSKYDERWRLNQTGSLPEGEQIYGYEQAVAHIAELRQSIYEGKKHLENAELEIRIKTTVCTTVPFFI